MHRFLEFLSADPLYMPESRLCPILLETRRVEAVFAVFLNAKYKLMEITAPSKRTTTKIMITVILVFCRGNFFPHKIIALAITKLSFWFWVLIRLHVGGAEGI